MMSKTAALAVLIATISTLPGTKASPVKNQQSQEKTNGTLGLPTIVYGSISQQLGNEYQSAGQAQAEGNSSAPGAPTVYGSTTSQVNNKYVTIGHAGHVYLHIPTINEPLVHQPDSVPEFSKPQAVDAGGLIFNANDPVVEDLEEFIEDFDFFRTSFNRRVHLASPFLIDNEITPVLRKDAKSDIARQTIEAQWLTRVISHRMKLIEMHELMASMYYKLASHKEVTEEINAVKVKVDELNSSEDEFRVMTQDLMINIL